MNGQWTHYQMIERIRHLQQIIFSGKHKSNTWQWHIQTFLLDQGLFYQFQIYRDICTILQDHFWSHEASSWKFVFAFYSDEHKDTVIMVELLTAIIETESWLLLVGKTNSELENLGIMRFPTRVVTVVILLDYASESNVNRNVGHKFTG